MKTHLLIALSFGSLFFASSCTKDIGPDPALIPKNVNICDSVKFSSTIKPIIDANCATSGCHVPGGSGPGDFTSFPDISLKVQNGSFKARVIDGVPGFMPATGRLPQPEIDKITCWLNAGAPNN
ncbi:MAG: hypothetical protein O9353_03750 [Bacteroidia bacterium]|nr:hypothetical protein [Bacteroidia bacterium]